MTNAKAGYNTLLKRGDGGVGAATQASRTIGSSNSQIVIKAKAGVSALVGTLGNTMSCQIVVSGNNTPLSVSVSGSGANASLTINSATNGSAVATSTINDIIALCSTTAAVDALFDFTTGAGNGTGVLAAAAALAFLASGANGGEAFTTVAEVTNIGGPSLSLDTVDATHMTSTNAWREFIATLKDGGEVTLDINYVPEDSTHVGVWTDMSNRTLRNWQVVWPNAAVTTWSFAAFVASFEPGAAVDDKLSASIGLKISGQPTLA
jgi:predicted secreted protein